MGEGLALCSGAEAVKRLQRAGWSVVRQKGSHVMMVNWLSVHTIDSPTQELGPGLLRKLLRQAALTVEEFTALKG